MVKIEYFNNGHSLGVFDLKERSSEEDRQELAGENNIDVFDRFTLDGDRLDVARLDVEGFYVDAKGFLWIVKGKGQGYEQAISRLASEDDRYTIIQKFRKLHFDKRLFQLKTFLWPRKK